MAAVRAALALGLAVAAGGVVRWILRFPGRSTPGLPRGSPGPLSPRAELFLAALSEAVVGRPWSEVDPLELFRHRAASIPGYRRIYEEMARKLDRQARRRGARVFASLAPEDRRGLLREVKIFPQRPRWRGLRDLPHRQRFRFDRFVIREILHLYVHTEAWLHLGYPARPGLPRGLGAYTHPLPAPTGPFR